MKEASGELNMTLITIIAVGIIGAIFYALWPQIRNAINSKWSDVESNNINETQYQKNS